MNVMKRAYPQYLASGGELLPRDVQVVIFPLAYWETIRKYAAANELDPYIVAALTAQESTFVADIKSYAGAVGLMQFMIPDAREWARKVGLAYSASLRSNADASLRMGTAYLADLVRRFDNHVYLALAAYNAGPGRVHTWVDQRPGMSQEEFIEDIPYPQTQNYVKKVLATAEDYRRLYGPDAEHGSEPDLDAKILPVVSVVKKPAQVTQAAPATKSTKPAATKRPAAKPPSSKAPASKTAAKTSTPASSSKARVAAQSKPRTAAQSRK
jgi:soluble lytic murein transglycosylase